LEVLESRASGFHPDLVSWNLSLDIGRQNLQLSLARKGVHLKITRRLGWLELPWLLQKAGDPIQRALRPGIFIERPQTLLLLKLLSQAVHQADWTTEPEHLAQRTGNSVGHLIVDHL